MVSLKNKNKGFTIVELLIVIVVIGILATLVIVTFTGIQQKARNSQRQTDINALASHIEAFYADKGYYPSAKDLQTPSFVSGNLKGLDSGALLDPKQTAADATISGTTVSDDPVVYQYSYVAATGCDNTAVTSDTNQCTGYTLTAHLEGGASDFVKKSST